VGMLTALVARIGAEPVHGGFVVRPVELDYLHEMRRDRGTVVVGATAALAWLYHYNHRRPHSTIGQQPPSTD